MRSKNSKLMGVDVCLMSNRKVKGGYIILTDEGMGILKQLFNAW